jgi:hypothetical protein
LIGAGGLVQLGLNWMMIVGLVLGMKARRWVRVVGRIRLLKDVEVWNWSLSLNQRLVMRSL